MESPVKTTAEDIFQLIVRPNIYDIRVLVVIKLIVLSAPMWKTEHIYVLNTEKNTNYSLLLISCSHNHQINNVYSNITSYNIHIYYRE